MLTDSQVMLIEHVYLDITQNYSDEMIKAIAFKLDVYIQDKEITNE